MVSILLPSFRKQRRVQTVPNSFQRQTETPEIARFRPTPASTRRIRENAIPEISDHLPETPVLGRAGLGQAFLIVGNEPDQEKEDHEDQEPGPDPHQNLPKQSATLSEARFRRDQNCTTPFLAAPADVFLHVV